MNKKYFWLKLHNDFFNQLAIKKLRLLEHGALYTIIYLKLQLLSITTGGQLFSQSLEDSIVQELALEINETLENVQDTLFFLEKYHLLEVLDESCLLLPKVAEVIGSEAASTERVRKMRQNNLATALQCNSNVTKSNTELELEIKKEINVELYSDKDLKESLPVKLNTVATLSLATDIDLVLPEILVDRITTTPINNIIYAETVSLSTEEPAQEIVMPIEEITPKILSPREIRIARENLQEEHATKRKMQIITERILSRINNEKPSSKVPVINFSPAIILEDSFEDFWRSHPHAYDRASTFRVWQQTLAQGISAADLVYAAKKYALKIKNNQTSLCYVSSSRNFLLNNKFWEFLPTYSLACPHCHGKGTFSKTNTSGEQDYYSCNCHQRYQNLPRTTVAVKASA